MTNPIACPQCKFRLPPGGHICRTCGYVVPRAPKPEAPQAKEVAKRGETSIWQFLLNPEDERTKKEKRREGPALGET